MKIVIDARSLSGSVTGIGHYLASAINAMAESHPEVEMHLLSHRDIRKNADALLIKRSNIIVHSPIFYGRVIGIFWFLILFPILAARLRANVLWGPSGVLPVFLPRGMKCLLTIHDFVYRELPWTMSLRNRVIYGILTGSSIRQCDQVWAVSNYTAECLIKYYPVMRRDRVIVGSGLNSVRGRFFLNKDDLDVVRERFLIDRKTLLFVGTLEPRKNVGFFLDLMPNLHRHGYKALIVGCAGWGRDEVSSVVSRPDFPVEAVEFLSYISDEDLYKLYMVCDFVISTSLMEGFGLPLLEAMSVGCPVIAPRNSAITEVVGSGGRLIDGWDRGLWVSEIVSAQDERDRLSELAIIQAGKFDMKEVCKRIIDRVYC